METTEEQIVNIESPIYSIEAIHIERIRQIANKGYSANHDDDHSDGILANVAAQLILNENDLWGLTAKYAHDRMRQLVIAGALIAAEIDRLARLTLSDTNKPQHETHDV